MHSLEISVEELKALKIQIYDPFSSFLGGSVEESNFEVSLLDVVRFSGHACPSIVGAFLIAQKVVKEFYPETGVIVRGEVEVGFGSAVNQGATGPISNVFGFLFGAWADSGFGGLQGQFVRRGLVHYSVPEVPAGTFLFRNLRTGASIQISYHPASISVSSAEQMTFQKQWRQKIKLLIQNPDSVLQCRSS